jgi:hypothetical protein
MAVLAHLIPGRGAEKRGHHLVEEKVKLVD